MRTHAPGAGVFGAWPERDHVAWAGLLGGDLRVLALRAEEVALAVAAGHMHAHEPCEMQARMHACTHHASALVGAGAEGCRALRALPEALALDVAAGLRARQAVLNGARPGLRKGAAAACWACMRRGGRRRAAVNAAFKNLLGRNCRGRLAHCCAVALLRACCSCSCRHAPVKRASQTPRTAARATTASAAARMATTREAVGAHGGLPHGGLNSLEWTA